MSFSLILAQKIVDSTENMTLCSNEVLVRVKASSVSRIEANANVVW